MRHGFRGPIVECSDFLPVGTLRRCDAKAGKSSGLQLFTQVAAALGALTVFLHFCEQLIAGDRGQVGRRGM